MMDFQNNIKDINPHVQLSQLTPSRINQRDLYLD